MGHALSSVIVIGEGMEEMFPACPVIARIFTAEWLEGEGKTNHIIAKLAWRATNPAFSGPRLKYIESRFEALASYDLLDNSDLRDRLKNDTLQFISTMAEVDVILLAAENGLKPIWGNEWPDIVLPDLSADIEVKTLSMSKEMREKMEKKPGDDDEYAIELDDIGRLNEVIQTKVMGKMASDRACVLVVGVDDLSYDEFVDYFSPQSDSAYLATTIEHLSWHGGAFSCGQFAPMCAAVWMRGYSAKWLLSFEDHDNAPRSPVIEGLLNPNRTRDLDPRVIATFNIHS